VTSLGAHAAELLALLVIVAGPVPCGLVLAASRRRSVAEQLLTTLLAWSAIQAALALGLGLAGELRLGPVLLAETALFVSGAFGARRAIMAVGGPAPPLDPVEWLVVAAIALLGVSLLFQLAVRPITEVDSLGYHLPPMARWIQAGALAPLERTDLVSRYPYGWELLATPFLLAFHEDFLVTAPNIIAWIMLGLATYLIARLLGSPRLHALVAVLALLVVPTARAQLPVMRVDLALAAFVVSGVFFGLVRDAPLCLAALGLSIAMKTSALVYVPLVAAAWVLTPYRRADRLPSWMGMAVATAAMAAGTFWYVRNWIELGNPLGLVRVTLGSLTIFPGRFDPASLRPTTLAGLFMPTDLSHWKLLGSVARQTLGLPALLLAAGAAAMLVPPWPRPRRPLGIVLGLIVASLSVYVTTPFSGDVGGINGWRLTPWIGQNVRYALTSLALVAAVGAAGWARMGGRIPVLAAAVVIFAGATNRSMLAAALMLALAGVAVVLRSVRPRAALAVLALLCVLAITGSRDLRHIRAAERRIAYGGLDETLTRELPAGTAIGHVANTHSFLFYGTRLTNRIVYVPARGMGHDAWVDLLRARGVGLVALGPLNPRKRWGPERGWLEDPNGPLIRVAGTDPARETVLYRWR